MAKNEIEQREITLFKDLIHPDQRVDTNNGVVIYAKHAKMHLAFMDMVCNAIFQAYTTNIKYQLKSLITTDYILIKYNDDSLGVCSQKDVSIHKILNELLLEDIEPFEMQTIIYTPFVSSETIRQIAIKRALK